MRRQRGFHHWRNVVRTLRIAFCREGGGWEERKLKLISVFNGFPSLAMTVKNTMNLEVAEKLFYSREKPNNCVQIYEHFLTGGLLFFFYCGSCLGGGW